MTHTARPAGAACRRPILVLLTAILGLAAGAAHAAWLPQRPDGPAIRYRLSPAADGSAPLRGIWTLLAPGDSVVFDLDGEGPVRLETRPLYRTGDETDAFRLAVRLGAERRLFRRLAPRADEVRLVPTDGGPPIGPVGVGEVDRLELDWTAGHDRLLVRNRVATGRDVLCRVLVPDDFAGLPDPPEDLADFEDQDGPDAPADLAARAAAADAEPDSPWSWRVDAPRIGWDSNAYLDPRDGPAPTAKVFLPVGGSAAYTRPAGERTEWRARYAFRGAFYDEPVLDETRHSLHLDLATRLGGRGARGGTGLAAGYRYVRKNDTFNGRGDRDEYETIDPVAGLPVSLGDRFDYGEHRLQVDLSRRLGRRVRAALTPALRRRDYVHDYANLPDVYSLDQSQWELAATVVWRAAPALDVTLAGAYIDRDYDEKFARDADGLELPDTPARISYRNLGVVAAWGRGAGLRAHAEFKLFASTDRQAGYWDFSGLAWETGVGWRWTGGHQVDLRVRLSSKDYDNAHLDHDPALALREKTYLNLRLQAERRLGKHWRAGARFHYKDADNNNRLFAYRRTEIIVGLSYRR